MQITNEDKRAIDAAVEKLHFVKTTESGNRCIEIYADYRDNNEGLLEPAYENRRLGFETKDDPQHALLDRLKEEIYNWYTESIWNVEDEILQAAGFDPCDDKRDELLDYLRENYSIEPDYDHFLMEETHVNLMLKCGDESNRDFIGIHEQFQAMFADDWSEDDRKAAMEEENGLSWLIKQQGHTMAELEETVHAYYAFFDSDEADGMSYDEKYNTFRASHNPFLTSVCQELANMVNYMNTMTVLTSISLESLADFMQPGKEIVIPKDAMLGIFNPWNGGGSTLDVELENDLVIPSDHIFDIQIEGVKPDHGYSVDNVYGLVGNAWKSAKAVRDAETGDKAKAPSLDSLIASAENRAGEGAEGPTRGPDKAR